MDIFGFGKSYTKNDLDREITKLRELYVQALVNLNAHTRKELTLQLKKVLEVSKKGGFNGSEIVEWPTSGSYTSLRNVTPGILVMIDTM